MPRPSCAAPSLLAALAAVTCGEAIRFHPSEEEPGASLNRATGCSAAVPKLDVFRRVWHKKMSEQPPAQEVPEEERPRLVVGVFSTAKCTDRPVRDVIRSTWMAQMGVCPLGRHEGPQAGCSLHVTFVVGQSGPGGEEAEQGEDITVLPIPENMNCGKTPAWFQHASTQYPWATHIVKMDMDAFPFVPELVGSIRTRSPARCRNLIGGESHIVAEVEPNETLRGMPLTGDFLRCSNPRKPVGCWSYMQGGLYLLTPELARNASAPGGWWQEESKKCGPEDAVAGKAIFRYGLANDVCVGPLLFQPGREYWHGRGGYGVWNRAR